MAAVLEPEEPITAVHIDGLVSNLFLVTADRVLLYCGPMLSTCCTVPTSYTHPRSLLYDLCHIDRLC
jgi:hypothetical protein